MRLGVVKSRRLSIRGKVRAICGILRSCHLLTAQGLMPKNNALFSQQDGGRGHTVASSPAEVAQRAVASSL